MSEITENQPVNTEELQQRESSCVQEINEILKKYNCKIDASMTLSEGKVSPKLTITAL